jgi:hypothetical protein
MLKIKFCVCLILFVPFADTVLAQTACPYGVNPGSSSCGPMPDSASSMPPPPPVPTGEWESSYGAVAMDLAANVVGTSDNHVSRAAAEGAAIQACHSKGASNCELYAWAENQCLALAWPTGGGGGVARTGLGKTKLLAEKKALTRCIANKGKCEVMWSACNEPVFHPY